MKYLGLSILFFFLPTLRKVNFIFKHDQTFELNTGSKAIPPLRAHHALGYDEKNKCIFMTAGSTPVDGGNSYVFYNDLWCFDGMEWKQNGNAGDVRSGIGLAYNSKQDKFYSFGGFANNKSLSDLRVLNAGEWNSVSDLPEMKAAEPGFVYDMARDRLIVFGGSGGRGLSNADTWEWDGSSWKKFEGTGPAARHAFAMIYDSKRKKTVLYGGAGISQGELYSDTWEFDGKRWTKVADSSGPGSRISPGYAYDSKRGMFLIFGGIVDQKVAGDTWGWNGTEWKKLSETGPSPRVMGYMAYDKNRDRVVIFGGRLGWPNDINDTWEWDGENWNEIK